MICSYPLKIILPLENKQTCLSPGMLVRHQHHLKSLGTIIGIEGELATVMWSIKPQLFNPNIRANVLINQ